MVHTTTAPNRTSLKPTGRRAIRFARWTVTTAVILGGLPLVDSVEAYRFFSDRRTDQYPVLSEHAARWSPDIWDSGTTLTWVIADDPGWTSDWMDEEGMPQPPPLAGPEEVVPFVAQALRAWSDIESADIRWEVSGVDESLNHREPNDGRPTIFVDPEATRGSYAAIWIESIGDRRFITDCDVPL